jgi:hypothetical protein
MKFILYIIPATAFIWAVSNALEIFHQAAELKIIETAADFIGQVKQFCDKLDDGVYDALTVSELADQVMKQAFRSKSAIHGISMLLIKSRMQDFDNDEHCAEQIDAIADSAIERFKARKETN